MTMALMATVSAQAFEYLHTDKDNMQFHATIFSANNSIEHKRNDVETRYTRTGTGVTLNYKPSNFQITSKIVKRSFNNGDDTIDEAHIDIGYLFNRYGSLPLYSAISRTSILNNGYRDTTSLNFSVGKIKENTLSETNIKVSQYDGKSINIGVGISRIFPLSTQIYLLVKADLEYFSFKQFDHIELHDDSFFSVQLGMGADIMNNLQASVIYTSDQTDENNNFYTSGDDISIIQQGLNLQITGKF